MDSTLRDGADTDRGDRKRAAESSPPPRSPLLINWDEVSTLSAEDKKKRGKTENSVRRALKFEREGGKNDVTSLDTEVVSKESSSKNQSPLLIDWDDDSTQDEESSKGSPPKDPFQGKINFVRRCIISAIKEEKKFGEWSRLVQSRKKTEP